MTFEWRDMGRGRTILDLLWWRARNDADGLAFVMLADGETESERCTYAELADRVRAIAGTLRQHAKPGDRVMVLHAMGIDYAASLLGCFAAGAIAIPLHRPRRGRAEQRFALIREDSGARVALTASASLSDVQSALDDASLACLCTDDVAGVARIDIPTLERDSDVAYLQYTSGSTGTPRGVMVSHANLFANVRDIAIAIPYTPASRMVNWLPLYHDMGLVFGAMYPLYAGFPCYLMEPSAFQQEPLQWLRAMSRFRGTHTGGPTFAFALCADHAAGADLTGLDLSACDAAMCGAEPLHVETLDRFARAFAPCGFRREAIGAGYGLAESTLMVTVQLGGVQAIDVSAAALATGQIRPPAADGQGVRPVVSVGTPGPDTTILVVDPERGQPCARDATGEVWVAGPAVSSGYWNRPEESSATFGATMPGDARRYLRTGDLGFERNGRLFVTGRLKDLIIVRGRNHYPQDIEWTVGSSHDALRRNAGAAFSTEVDGAEALVIAQEVRRAAVRSLDADSVVRAIRIAVIETHGVAPAAVVLLKPGGLAITSSGKPRRRDCRRLFEEGALNPIAAWRRESGPAPANDLSAVDRSYSALEAWLRDRAARQLGVPLDAIDVREPFVRLGFDSLGAAELAAALSRRLRQPISPTLAYDYPSIGQLARHLSVDGARGANRSAPSGRSAKCPIAVVGMACRLPGAPDMNAFARLLAEGRDAVRELPDHRRTAAFLRALAEVPAQRAAVTRGGWLDNVDGFDEQFFGISAREAAYIDPQQRLLLEVAWEALEHGAIAPDRLAGRDVGVFIGISDAEYRGLSARGVDARHPWAGTGTALSVAANRLSYVLDLKGPSLAIDTACSSSLVAVHEACEALRDDDVELAIAGGVNVILTPDWSVVFARAGMLSADGRCKTFDVAADGYVRGEGCGVVVLKSLDDAMRDRDRIHAVVLGSAVNHDGRSNGLTAPNGPAQREVARRALARAGVDASHVGYVEAHGTGTALGDPIELNALRAVYGAPAEEPCRVGAVKSNIGHLEAAAGIAGFIKTVLVLESGVVPPNLNFTSCNPEIDLAGSRMAIASERSEWARPRHGRHAAVSAFGFGGTNAHVVLREPPSVTAPPPTRRAPLVLAFSARDPIALRDIARRYADVLGGLPADASAIDAVCRTAALGRAQFEHRAAIAAPSASSMRAALTAWVEDTSPADVRVGAPRVGQPPRVAFLFTGQGALRAGAGRELFDREPVFRDALLRCDAVARQRGLSVIEGLQDPSLPTSAAAQAVLFAVEYALAELWRSFGVVPYAVLGHSLGEYAAACVAGVVDMEDAMRIVVERGRLTHALRPGGAMLAVNGAPEDVSALVASSGLSIAAINAPDQLVLSGDAEALAEAATTLAMAGIEATSLRVAHAFHHSRMRPIVEPLVAAFRQIGLRAPSIPLISNVTGGVAKAEVLEPEYWGQHTLMPVRFMDGVRTLGALGCDVFMEVGPAPVLLPLAVRALPPDDRVRWVAGLRPGRDDHEAIADSLAELHATGVAIDWAGVHADTSTEHADLPTYPFQRRRHWVADGPATERDVPRIDQATRAPEVRRVPSASEREALFETMLDARSTSYLADHRVAGKLWTPGASFLSMSVEACAALGAGGCVCLEDVCFVRPLPLDPDLPATVQIVAALAGDASRTLDIASAPTSPGGSWTRHVSAMVGTNDQSPRRADLAALRSSCAEPVAVDSLYERLAAAGLDYGASIRGVRELYLGDGAILARVVSGDDTAPWPTEHPLVHPVLLDACFQSLAALLPNPGAGVFVPASIARLHVSGPIGRDAWCHAVLIPADDGTPRVNISLVSMVSGLVNASVEGLALGRLDTGIVVDLPGDCVHALQWLPRPIAAEDDAARPAEICAAVEAALGATDACDALSAYTVARPILEAGSRAYAIAALRSVSALPGTSGRSTAELAGAAGISSPHLPLLERLLSLAAEEGVVRRDDDGWTILRSELPDPHATLAPLRDHANRSAPELALLDACGPIIGDVLTGRCDPLAVLFGDGDSGRAFALYHESPGAFVLNSAARAAVRSMRARAFATRPLRILEIGGGTGGVTASLLAELDGAPVEYTFTDVATVFLAQAKRRFGARPGFVARALDIERAPELQGFAIESYDVVVAANVLHATRDLSRSLAHARALLAPLGTLLLVEGTTPQPFLDVTVGLTDGWWRFDDRDLRPSYPLLDAGTWVALLARSGFGETAHLTPGSGTQHDLGQSLIVAVRAETRVPRWLVLEDRGGVGRALAARLGESGAVTIMSGDDASSADALAGALADTTTAAPLRGVVDLRGLDVVTADDASSGADVMRSCLDASAGVLDVVQRVASLNTGGATASPRLWIVTRGAQPAPDHQGMPGLAAAPLLGLARTIAFEHPELRCARVDLDPGGEADEIDRLATELRIDSDEEEIAFRRGVRFVARIASVDITSGSGAPPPIADQSATYELVAETPGELDTLRFLPRARRAPGAGEVEIRIDATALHFRDVLKTLGAAAYAADGAPLGTECAGEVLRVGADVTELAVGDAVVALSSGAFQGHLTLPATLVVRRPDRLRADQAVDVGAYVTARMALERLADIRDDDTVLVHAAAGATGLAALDVARRHGAEVLGTASPWKWPALRARGVRHVFHSRDVAFSASLRQATGGKGVRIVLNSLTGAAIEAGMRSLDTGGCFVELGMTEVLTREAAESLRPDVRYRALDLAAEAERAPAAMRAMMTEVVESLASGVHAPLPHHRFPLDSVREAFRFLQHAQHIGRVVIDHRARAGTTVRFDEHASYLITGGLGGIGLLVSQWMAERGARHLVLVGRRSPDVAGSRVIADLANRGVTVRTVSADVADGTALEGLIREIEAGDARLRGVIHAAGVLDDGVLTRQHADRFANVYRPKVAGAWDLHRLTRHLSLDFFMMFSSAASLLGAPGQGNHAAANAFLDALAQYRRACGLPASSIQWGAWSDAGAAARHRSAGLAHGASLRTISPAEGLALLDALWTRSAPVLAAVRIDWPSLVQSTGVARRPLLELMAPRGAARAATVRPDSADRTDGRSLLERLAAADPADRSGLVRAFVSEQVTRVLGLSSPELLGSRHGFFELGMDSLTSLELRNALQREIGRPLPSTLTFDYPTVERLSAWLHDELVGRAPTPADEPPAAIVAGSHADAAAEVAALTAHELAIALEREVRSILSPDVLASPTP